jgi:hypothetical protein
MIYNIKQLVTIIVFLSLLVAVLTCTVTCNLNQLKKQDYEQFRIME